MLGYIGSSRWPTLCNCITIRRLSIRIRKEITPRKLSPHYSPSDSVGTPFHPTALANHASNPHQRVHHRTQANDADREEHDRNAATVESCHLRRLDDLKERARATTDEALQTALAEADRLAKGASETSRVANGARLVVIDSAVGWIDRAARVEANTSERRLRKRKDRVALQATAMAEFDQTVSEEQRDWLCRVKERGREALTAARLAVTDRVEEIIRGHRGERTDEQRGGGSVTATSCDCLLYTSPSPRD